MYSRKGIFYSFRKENFTFFKPCPTVSTAYSVKNLNLNWDQKLFETGLKFGSKPKPKTLIIDVELDKNQNEIRTSTGFGSGCGLSRCLFFTSLCIQFFDNFSTSMKFLFPLTLK